jgi:HAD superfamily hydrolase (TIGR01509 family)
MSPIRHVIFDCDGVLVDSELLSQEIEESIARDLGLPLTRDDMKRYTGRSTAEQWREISTDYGITLPENFAEWHFERARSVYQPRLRLIDGVAAMLGALTPGVSVASNSSRPQLDLKLALTGIAAHFAGRSHSCDDVAQPKPAPDIYLRAASTAGFPPERCLVVEDSPTGARAALAAGAIVLGFAGGSHGDAATAEALRGVGVTRIFDDMAALPAIVADWPA